MSAEPDAAAGSPSGGEPGDAAPGGARAEHPEDLPAEQGPGGAAPGHVLPLQPGDPARLGPYAVVGRLDPGEGTTRALDRRGPDLVGAPRPDAAEAAAVLAAHAPDGTPVRVVLLGSGPSGDAAARDRFGAAVADLGAQGRLLGSSLAGPWPWAATRASDARSAAHLARSPLAAPGLAGDPPRGPAFAPHWSGGTRPEPSAAVPAPPTGAPARDRRPWLLSALLGLLLLAAVVLLLTGACEPSAQEPEPAPSSSRPAPEPSPQPSPEPTAPRAPTPGDGEPAPGEEGSPLLLGPGVVGPSFGPGEDTETLTLEDLPFSFRVPAGWSCERADLPSPVVRYDCASPDGASGGAVQLQPCPVPCGQQAWEALQDVLAPGATWFEVDPTTVAAEDSLPGREDSYRLRMSHLLVAGEREESDLAALDSHLYAEFWSPASDRGDVQGVVNDLRANTP
ncbi:hypothetical protein [uncultured Pseudokineococcus sp.]|uniref:hypothetical protein n=1 Tax=uncultured Pseudokineococcus sp. TaxID=1642928 RepID=UPI0026331F5D|nr:hypothetical protein [uncultured Pseudokineococcus sp.]